MNMPCRLLPVFRSSCPTPPPCWLPSDLPVLPLLSPHSKEALPRRPYKGCQPYMLLPPALDLRRLKLSLAVHLSSQLHGSLQAAPMPSRHLQKHKRQTDTRQLGGRYFCHSILHYHVHCQSTLKLIPGSILTCMGCVFCKQSSTALSSHNMVLQMMTAQQLVVLLQACANRCLEMPVGTFPKFLNLQIEAMDFSFAQGSF